MPKLLAFDMSTTVLGYSVFDLDTKELIKMDYFTLSGEGKIKDDLVVRGFTMKKIIDALVDAYEITHFAIEERLKSFRAGGTNADAMLKTAQLNFLCQFLIIEKGIELHEINVNTARSQCFPNFHRIARAEKGVKQKEIAFKMATAILGEDKFPTKVMKSGPRKGETVFLEEAKDMADSYVIGKAFINLNK